MTMTRAELINELTLGGPGLVGYAYQAELLCPACGRAAVPAAVDALMDRWEEVSLLDPYLGDTDSVPCPVWAGELGGTEVCEQCGEVLE